MFHAYSTLIPPFQLMMRYHPYALPVTIIDKNESNDERVLYLPLPSKKATQQQQQQLINRRMKQEERNQN
jgi:hypothetical protein